MAINRSVKGNFNFNNVEKKDKNFMYKNLRRSNCYNCNFAGSNFNYASFRGAHFKTCSFIKCSFTGTEFVGSNLRSSKFKNAKFENTIFEAVNLENADFKDADFKNVIFLECDIDNTLNFDFGHEEIRIFDEMPELEISDALKAAVAAAMTNDFVKNSRVLDTKEGKLHNLNLMILLENFEEETLIAGLNKIATDLDKDFYTLSYITRFIQNIDKEVADN